MTKLVALSAFAAAIILAAPAAAAELSDGTYSGRFPDGCGTMVIKGSKINYSFGPCGGTPTYRSTGKFDGKVIRIGAATYTVLSTSSNNIRGRWQLNNYTGTITFKK